MCLNPRVLVDLIIFIEEILNEKLHILSNEVTLQKIFSAPVRNKGSVILVNALKLYFIKNDTNEVYM